MGFVGADPEDLERLANRLHGDADRLAEIRGAVGARLHFSPWSGRDADQMRHDWDTRHVRTLLTCEDALRQASSTIRGNAAAQRTTSTSDEDDGFINKSIVNPIKFVLGTQALVHGLATLSKRMDFEKPAEKIPKIGKSVGHVLGETAEELRKADLEELLTRIPRYGEILGHGAKFFPYVSLGIDALDITEGIRSHKGNDLAYDGVVTGLDAVAVVALATGVGAPVAAVAAGLAGVLSIVGTYEPAKDFIGGGIVKTGGAYIDSVVHPWKNPVATVAIAVGNPLLAPVIVGSAVIQGGVSLFKKLF